MSVACLGGLGSLSHVCRMSVACPSHICRMSGGDLGSLTHVCRVSVACLAHVCRMSVACLSHTCPQQPPNNPQQSQNNPQTIPCQPHTVGGAVCWAAAHVTVSSIAYNATSDVNIISVPMVSDHVVYINVVIALYCMKLPRGQVSKGNEPHPPRFSFQNKE